MRNDLAEGEPLGGGNGNSLQGEPLSVTQTHLLVQLLAFLLSLALLIAEVWSGGICAREVMRSAGQGDYRYLIIWQTGLSLLFLVAALYGIVFVAARREGQSFAKYSAASFSYLKPFSLLSDLSIKFLVFCLVLLASKPEWVFPVLFIFTGDYLLQGRLFTIPLKPSLFLGVACFVGGTALFCLKSSSFVPPLAGFTVASAVSLFFVFKAKKNHSSDIKQNA